MYSKGIGLKPIEGSTVVEPMRGMPRRPQEAVCETKASREVEAKGWK